MIIKNVIYNFIKYIITYFPYNINNIYIYKYCVVFLLYCTYDDAVAGTLNTLF